jgi:hypothetical protein
MAARSEYRFFPVCLVIAENPPRASDLLETITMPTVEFTDDKKYGKAIALLLYEVGGLFWTKPVRRLIVGPGQLQALQAAGPVPKNSGVKKHGRKKN